MPYNTEKKNNLVKYNQWNSSESSSCNSWRWRFSDNMGIVFADFSEALLTILMW